MELNARCTGRGRCDPRRWPGREATGARAVRGPARADPGRGGRPARRRRPGRGPASSPTTPAPGPPPTSRAHAVVRPALRPGSRTAHAEQGAADLTALARPELRADVDTPEDLWAAAALGPTSARAGRLAPARTGRHWPATGSTAAAGPARATASEPPTLGRRVRNDDSPALREDGAVTDAGDRRSVVGQELEAVFFAVDFFAGRLLGRRAAGSTSSAVELEELRLLRRRLLRGRRRCSTSWPSTMPSSP